MRAAGHRQMQLAAVVPPAAAVVAALAGSNSKQRRADTAKVRQTSAPPQGRVSQTRSKDLEICKSYLEPWSDWQKHYTCRSACGQYQQKQHKLYHASTNLNTPDIRPQLRQGGCWFPDRQEQQPACCNWRNAMPSSKDATTNRTSDFCDRINVSEYCSA